MSLFLLAFFFFLLFFFFAPPATRPSANRTCERTQGLPSSTRAKKSYQPELGACVALAAAAEDIARVFALLVCSGVRTVLLKSRLLVKGDATGCAVVGCEAQRPGVHHAPRQRPA